MNAFKKILKILGLLALALVAGIVFLVMTSDQSPRARLAKQFPWRVQATDDGPYLEETIALEGCTVAVTARQHDADGTVLQGSTVRFDWQQVNGDTVRFDPAYLTLPMQDGQFAVCTDEAGQPCALPERDTVQINLPRITDAERGANYLENVRALVAECAG